MKSRFLLWWMSFSASVALLVAQKLNAVGQIIALGLEGSYPDATGFTTAGRKRWKSPVGFLTLTKWHSKRNKLE